MNYWTRFFSLAGTLALTLHLMVEAPAQTTEMEESDDLSISWYRPQISGRTEETIGVEFSGQTLPGARVYLRNREIYKFSREGGLESLILDETQVEHLPALADQHGRFFFKVSLPEGHYQIPVVAFKPHAQNRMNYKSYRLSLQVGQNEVLLGDGTEDLGPSFLLHRRNHVSFGLGGNYIVYQKRVPGIPMDVNFTPFKIGSLFFEYWRRVHPEWALALNLKSSPGSTNSGSSVEVQGGDYNWLIANLDALYYPENWYVDKKGSYYMKVAVRMGLQHHMVPFMRAIEAGSNIQGMATNSVTMLAAGLQADLTTGPEWDYEVFVRYQHPVHTGSVFELTPQFAFDGSVGAQYNFPGRTWALGAFWYGQWHDYQIGEYDLFRQESFTGTQTIFFSNLEARIIYNF